MTLFNRFSVVFLIFALHAHATAVLCAQEERLTAAPDQYRIFGTVTDANGNAISNATASLVITPGTFDFIGKFQQEPDVSSANTDKSGGFNLQSPGSDARWNAVNKRTQILIVIQAKGFATAIQSVGRERLLVDLPLNVTLQTCRDYKLKVVSADGQPVTDAMVTPANLGHALPLKNKLFKPMPTDDAGLIEVEGIQQDLLTEVNVVSEGYGTHQVAVRFDGDIPVAKLPPTGTVKGTYELPAGVDIAELSGKDVFVCCGNIYGQQKDLDRATSWQIVSLNDQGKFEASNLCYGNVSFRLLDAEEIPYCSSLQDVYQPATLSATKPLLSLSRKLYKAKEIQLRFVDGDGKLIERVFNDNGIQGGAASNRDGIITIRIPEGEKPSGQLFPYDATGRFQVTDPFGIMLDRMKSKNSEYEPIELVRSRSLAGRVVDETGQVVAGAKIAYTLKSERFTLTKNVLANQSGDFRIDGLAPNTMVKITASKGNSQTPMEAAISVMAGSPELIHIAIAPQPVASIAGRILAQDGTPIPDAKVQLNKAVVSEVEAFGGERLAAVELLPNFDGARTDEDGKFNYPKTTQFKERIQVAVSAPGFRELLFPFIDGSKKSVDAGNIDLGEFRLFKLPAVKSSKITVVDEASGQPIAGVQVVFVSIDSGKRVATTDENGRADVSLLDTGQLVAAKADGYELSLTFIDRVSGTTNVSLTQQTTPKKTLSWLDKPWEDYHSIAKSLLSEIEVPAPKESTYYRQSQFFAAQLNTDFPAFKKAMQLPDGYEHQQTLLMLNAGPVFLNSPQEAVSMLMATQLAPMQKCALLGQFALLADDEDLKEELYGEAIVQLDACSGNKKKFAVGQLVSNLVIDGQIETAKELIAEAWESATVLKEQLKSKEPKTRIGESRIFTPVLALIDPDASIVLTRLTGDEQEIPGLITQCLSFASIAGDHDIDAICKKHGVTFNANGLSRQIEGTSLSVGDYEVTANWIRANLDSMPDSVNKVAAIMFAARQMPPGQQRADLIKLAAKARQVCEVSYYWNDPAKEILEELPKFESLTIEEFDELLFATILHAPDKTTTMQLNGVYAGLIKMVAVRDPAIAIKLLEPAFENGAWLYRDPTWSAFDGNELIKAYAWANPKAAAEKARSLAERFANDDSVRKLQLLTSVITELNDISIRKGMLGRPEK